MTDQNESNKLAKAPVTLKGMLAMDAVKERFDQVLKHNAGAFMASILNAVVASPGLADADPVSIINSGLQAAVMGLSISPSVGQAAIVPFNTRNGKKAQLIVMVRGLIQLAHNTRRYRHIHVSKIYEGESWTEDRLTGKLTLEGSKLSDKVIGRVAYFQLDNGFEKYLAMTSEEIEAHGRKYSKSYDDDKGYWKKNPDAMHDKTVTRMLLLHWGILSSDLRAALENTEPGEMQETIEGVSTDVTDAPKEPEPEQPRDEAQLMADLGY